MKQERLTISSGEKQWEIVYEGGEWRLQGGESERLSKLLRRASKGVQVRTVIYSDGKIGDGVKRIEDTDDPEYMIGLRAMLLENGFEIVKIKPIVDVVD